ncbi:acetyl-CoA C-acyltransferase [Schlesneria sp.]|uniref:acetyl-CoA C-acyltransferase n=1 Tax=Schlesneria sp. TaxID=2762018 RepID=UPI002F0A7554
MVTEVVIVAGKRTPIGRFLGGLADMSAVDLACAASEAALQNINRQLIDQVIVGNVLAAGLGMNLARQVGVKLGLPLEVPAYTVNMMCASGLQAVLLAAQAIRAGDSHAVLCGGTESMSNAPYLLPKARKGYKMGDGTLVDSLLQDGLVDSFDHKHMGVSVELLAQDYQITRGDQDAFALRSQKQYAAAAAANAFADEVIPVGKVTQDEHPRADTVLDKLASLKPAFNPSGTITAGNASGINDGAAMLVVANGEFARKHNWPILARLSGGAVQGCDPVRMGLGPVHAIRKLCSRHDWTVDRFARIEINEAFAAQALACQRELKVDLEKVNSFGGAIAVGHPIGASGARLAVHLAQQIAAGHTKSGLASLCVGGGMGIAAAFESP